jgi:hypothetical protein
VNKHRKNAKSLILNKRIYVDMKGIENWTINMNAGTITHKSGTVFTFERGEVIDIDLKGISTKALRVLTEEAISQYGKGSFSSTSLTSKSSEMNTGNPNSRRTRLSLSKNR